jgi:hypothetical protein
VYAWDHHQLLHQPLGALPEEALGPTEEASTAGEGTSDARGGVDGQEGAVRGTETRVPEAGEGVDLEGEVRVCVFVHAA